MEPTIIPSSNSRIGDLSREDMAGLFDLMPQWLVTAYTDMFQKEVNLEGRIYLTRQGTTGDGKIHQCDPHILLQVGYVDKDNGRSDIVDKMGRLHSRLMLDEHNSYRAKGTIYSETGTYDSCMEIYSEDAFAIDTAEEIALLKPKTRNRRQASMRFDTPLEEILPDPIYREHRDTPYTNVLFSFWHDLELDTGEYKKLIEGILAGTYPQIDER